MHYQPAPAHVWGRRLAGSLYRLLGSCVKVPVSSKADTLQAPNPWVITAVRAVPVMLDVRMGLGWTSPTEIKMFTRVFERYARVYVIFPEGSEHLQ